MNRTLKEATVQRYHYESYEQLRTHLADFLAAYNFAKRLKTFAALPRTNTSARSGRRIKVTPGSIQSITPRDCTPNTVQRVVYLALGPSPGETTHWTGRMLAKATGVSLRSVQRILEAHQLAPHRIRTFKLSNDAKFADKLRDIVGLYVDPPAHAVSSRSTRRARFRLLTAPSRACR